MCVFLFLHVMLNVLVLLCKVAEVANSAAKANKGRLVQYTLEEVSKE